MDGSQTTETVQQIDLTLIDPSPFQPKTRTKPSETLDELAASVKEKGVIVPALARPKGKRFELAAGHRRHKAADMAGLTHLPTIVREMSDEEVMEIQAIENLQREGLDPIDEAEGFARLVKLGRSAKHIGERIGKEGRYVLKRLQLNELGKEGRAALADNKITVDAAIVLLRVPDKLQGKAVKDLISFRHHEDGPVDAAEARRMVEEDLMLRLKDAPWKLDDAELVPAAGACSKCPKNTGSHLELFDDVKDEMCIDPACHKTKMHAYTKIRLKKAAEDGQAVLKGADAKKALGHSSSYTKVGERVYASGKSVEVSKTLLKKAEVPVTLAIDEQTGNVVELMREADVLKAAKIRPDAAQARSADADKAASKRAAAKEKRRKAVIAEAITRGAAKAASGKPEAVLEILLRAFIVGAWSDTQKAALARRGLEAPKGRHGGRDYAKALISIVDDSQSTADVASLAAEMALLMLAPNHPGAPRNDAWASTLESLGVDLDKVEQHVIEQEKAKEKTPKKSAEKKPTKAAGKDKKAGKRGVCKRVQVHGHDAVRDRSRAVRMGRRH